MPSRIETAKQDEWTEWTEMRWPRDAKDVMGLVVI